MPSSPGRKLVVFALWGGDPIYTQGALENLKLLPRFYPGWEARFYVADDCPVRDELSHLCEVVPKKITEGYRGLFWRLEPMNEKGVGRFISRDCDSRLSGREAVAVREWEESGLPFHVIRDCVHHRSPVLTGLFGAMTRELPSFQGSLRAWLRGWKGGWSKDAGADEQFMSKLWPDIQGRTLVHGFGGKPFPPHEPLEFGQYCGQQIGVDGKPLTVLPQEELYKQ